MHDTSVFEVDLVEDQIIFFQAGMFKEYIQSERLYGYKEFLKRSMKEFVLQEDHKILYETFGMQGLKDFEEAKTSISCDVRIRVDKGKEYQWFTVSAMLLHGLNRMIGTIENIHEQKISALEVQYRASHDPLTHLLNREVFDKKICEFVARGDRKGAYCLLDVDNFKSVNDNHGHAYGDRVLLDIAGVLKNHTPKNAFVSRFGGDEFNMFFPDLSDEESVTDILNSIIYEIGRVKSVIRSGVTVSIGVSLYPEHGATFENGFGECADIALYHVKDRGKNGFLIYSPKLGGEVASKKHQYFGQNNLIVQKAAGYQIREKFSFAAPIILSIFIAALILVFFVSSNFVFSDSPRVFGNDKAQSFYHLTMVAFTVISLLLALMITMIVILQLNKKRISQIAFTDEITGGRSKSRFESDVAQLLKQGSYSYTMIYANVNRFKLLNEQLGRQEADRLLKSIYTLFDGDMSHYECVGRLMADHFGILLHTQDIMTIQRNLSYWNEALAHHSSQLRGGHIATLSYGVYLIDEPGLDVSVIIDRANLARHTLSSEFDSGQALFAVYDEKLKQKMKLEKELEDRQELALLNGEFVMYLQPKYELNSETIAGAEALVRWITDDMGMICPDQFIPLFESNGFITKVDLYMFEMVCSFIKKILDQGYQALPVSVNLSRVHLKNDNFFNNYLDIWRSYEIPSDLIEFEITETMVNGNLIQLNAMIDKIHQNGFRVSMDDFGCGYSSLNMLKDVNLDVLKLDRNFFLLDEGSMEKGYQIVKHIIELAKDLNMDVVAEGIEDRNQVNYLKELHCDYIQGYYYDRPQPSDIILSKLSKII